MKSTRRSATPLVLLLVIAAHGTAVQAAAPAKVTSGDLVRLTTSDGSFVGTYLRTERGQYVLRDDDEDIVRVTTRDVRHAELAWEVPGSGRGLEAGLAVGAATLLAGGLMAENSSREPMLFGSERAILWTVTLLVTPVTSFAGYVLGSGYRAVEWVAVEPPADRSPHAALLRELRSERAARRLVRPLGVSWSASF